MTFGPALRLGGFIGREDRAPVRLHIDDSPASGNCFIECLVKTAHIGFAVVSPFAVRIGVMNKAHEAQANIRRRPFEHLLVAVGIAKGENRTPADEMS